MACVPAAFVKRLHSEAYADLADEKFQKLLIRLTDMKTTPSISSSDEISSLPVSATSTKYPSVNLDDEMSFLSDGDVLCTWWTKLAVSHLPASSPRTVCLNNTYPMRSRLVEDLLPSGILYFPTPLRS
jgi:hypothetical protein